MPIPVRLHRSELCVPGTSLPMLNKAPGLGADVVMLDLEDAVAPDDKAQARENVIAALGDLVRVPSVTGTSIVVPLRSTSSVSVSVGSYRLRMSSSV